MSYKYTACALSIQFFSSVYYDGMNLKSLMCQSVQRVLREEIGETPAS